MRSTVVFFAQLGGLGRCRRLMPQRQEPRRGQVGAGELERLRIEAPQLLAQPIAQAVQLRVEVIGHARPLAQLDDDRIFR
jgi:hypothetical protein